MPLQMSVPHEAIAECCRRNHIRQLRVFGSVLREDFMPESDVDLLVAFEPDVRSGGSTSCASNGNSLNYWVARLTW